MIGRQRVGIDTRRGGDGRGDLVWESKTRAHELRVIPRIARGDAAIDLGVGDRAHLLGVDELTHAIADLRQGERARHYISSSPSGSPIMRAQQSWMVFRASMPLSSSSTVTPSAEARSPSAVFKSSS